MANIVITSDTDYVYVEFGDFLPASGWGHAKYKRINIEIVGCATDHVIVLMDSGLAYKLALTPSEGMSGAVGIVATVDGNAPDDLANLFSMIKALMKV